MVQKTFTTHLVLALAGLVVLGCGGSPPETPAHHGTGSTKDSTTGQIVNCCIKPSGEVCVEKYAAEKTVHGVVHIVSEFARKSTYYDDFFGPFRDFFGYPYEGQGQTYTGFGSGVIISADGYIVTNNHVVEDASHIEVTLNDKQEFEATLIGTDPSTDLALIKIDGTDLPFITFGNSDIVKIGEWVLAVGNPFNLTSTVTAGIVSAKARNINILGTEGAIESFIQTDAAVNRGNVAVPW